MPSAETGKACLSEEGNNRVLFQASGKTKVESPTAAPKLCIIIISLQEVKELRSFSLDIRHGHMFNFRQLIPQRLSKKQFSPAGKTTQICNSIINTQNVTISMYLIPHILVINRSSEVTLVTSHYFELCVRSFEADSQTCTDPDVRSSSRSGWSSTLPGTGTAAHPTRQPPSFAMHGTQGTTRSGCESCTRPLCTRTEGF